MSLKKYRHKRDFRSTDEPFRAIGRHGVAIDPERLGRLEADPE